MRPFTNLRLVAAMTAALASYIPRTSGVSQGSIRTKRRNRRRHAKWVRDFRHDRGRKRLQMARGAGSINAKADILQLARGRKYFLAIQMAIAHERQCGERLFPSTVLDAWQRYEEGV